MPRGRPKGSTNKKVNKEECDNKCNKQTVINHLLQRRTELLLRVQVLDDEILLLKSK